MLIFFYLYYMLLFRKENKFHTSYIEVITKTLAVKLGRKVVD